MMTSSSQKCEKGNGEGLHGGKLEKGGVGGGDGAVLRPEKLEEGRAVLILTILHAAIFLKSRSAPVTPCLHSSWNGDQIPTEDYKGLRGLAPEVP